MIFLQSANPSACIGFPPSIDEHCTTLILGSMPGVTSLQQQQYYAHPHNRFWPLMACLLKQSAVPDTYEGRLSMLLCHHIALWDSIDTCERSGSLDTAIHNETGNDFSALFAQYPRLHIICFNGAKSFQSFKKYNRSLLKEKKLHFYALPSTSPANARWRLKDLAAVWGKALNDENPEPAY